LEQSQIRRFCLDHVDWLRKDGFGTFFLFKVKGEFFVAYVYWCEGRLKALVGRLSSVDVWYAEYRHRIVVPQLLAQP
jgi:hypothetical protein